MSLLLARSVRHLNSVRNHVPPPQPSPRKYKAAPSTFSTTTLKARHKMLLLLFPVLLLFASAAQRHDDHVFPADDIIELPVGRFPDPDCEYSVYRNGPYGPKVNGKVRVGDIVFHSWKCSYGALDSSMYCLMVNNCTVSSEQGSSSHRVPILDEFGCSLFPNILPHVEYPSDLNGGLLVHAFSLDVDQAAVFFECNVKLLLKLNGVCRRPTCPPLEELRGVRSRFRRRFAKA